MNGIIKRLNEKKFGFITPEGGAPDVFFHESALVGATWEDLREGAAVTFDSADSEKGPRAANVQLA